MSVFRAILRTQGVRWCATNSGVFKISLDTPVSCSSIDSRFKITAFLLPTLRRNYSTSSDVKSAVSGAKIKVDDVKSVKNEGNTKDTEVIYVGQLARNIRLIKAFSLSTSIVGISIQPFVYAQAVADGNVTALTLPIFALIGMFALATPPLLHMITKRYVLSVEYVPKDDKYIATVYNLFSIKRKIEFTPEDVTIPTVLGMFSTCAIKGKPMFLDATSFTDQDHYVRIMGYDKPLDLQVEENVKESDKKDTTKM